MHVQVYEYYDGYEYLWEEESKQQRPRVQYIVLGEMNDNDLIGICYLGQYNINSVDWQKKLMRKHGVPNISPCKRRLKLSPKQRISKEIHYKNTNKNTQN